ncbi:MAG: (Fe-S)-binding protein [Acidimicrobiales bacterium]
MKVGLFVTCVADVVAPDAAVAAVRVLRAAGHDVSVPRDQTCCGQPAWNAGFAEEAAQVARTTLASLDQALDAGVDRIVGLAGSCTAMVRVFWPELFEVVGDHDAGARARAVGARVTEFSEFLADEGLPEAARRPPDAASPRVAYHHSCHMLRELRIKQQPEAVLDAVGCERMRWSADDRCCGFGGTFSIKLPETSTAMADDKLRSIEESGAEVLVGADTSCLLHLAARAEHEGRPVVAKHIAEVVAESMDR